MFLTAPAGFYKLKQMWLVDAAAALTILTLVPVIAMLVLRFRSNGLEAKHKSVLLSLAASGLVLIFLVSLVSKPVWQYAPILSKIQFPWRFLAPASAIASISFALSIPLLYGHYRRMRRPLVYGIVMVMFAILLFDGVENMISSAPYSRELFQKEYGNRDEKKSCDCWLPAWAEKSALMRPARVSVGDRAVEVSQWEPTARRFAISEGQPQAARIGTFWYPYWRGEVNGSPALIERDLDGTILVPLPAERAEVRLYFQEPASLRAANYVSLIAWIGLALAIAISVLRRPSNGVRLRGLN
jgi:hypothetical protein